MKQRTESPKSSHISYDDESGACIYAVEGDIDVTNVPHIREELDSALEGGCTSVVLDLAPLEIKRVPPRAIFYDPWTERSGEAPVRDFKIALPRLTRSLVVSVAR